MIDIFQEIWDSLKHNKLRTFLTGFAVAWGIFMLIVLLGSGNGIVHAFSQNSEGLPTNVVQIYGGFTSKPYDGLQAGRSIEFDISDLKALEEAFPDRVISAEASVSTSGTLSAGSEYVSSSLQGVYPGYGETQGIKMKTGRFLKYADELNTDKVMVISSKTADILFPGRPNPAGNYVQVGNVSYQIIGVYVTDEMRGSDECYIPFSTLRLIYGKTGDIGSLLLRTQNMKTEADGERFEKDLRRVLGQLHRFDSSDDRAVWIMNRYMQMSDMNKAKDILNTALWVIGIFTLLSGIVGVSNIMLITVKERTREFGIRKALGARPSSILKLVITESVLITAVFGYIGMALGVAFTEYMNVTAGNKTVDFGVGKAVIFLNPTVDISVAIQATLTLIIAGTLAGFFPAWKAARVKPIEALRA